MTQHELSATGTYVGNGTTQNIIIGQAWQPGIIFIWSTLTSGSAANRAMCVYFAGQPTTSRFALDTEARYVSGSGITDTAYGFTVGSAAHINNNGTTFHWLAIRLGTTYDEGSFNGNTTHTLTLGPNDPRKQRTPGFFIHYRSTGTEKIWFAKLNEWDSPATETRLSEYTAAMVPDWGSPPTDIDIIDGGVVTASEADTASQFYRWVALQTGIVDSTSYFESGTYTGDGGASRTIVLGYQPKWLMIFGGGTNQSARYKTNTMSSGNNAVINTQYDWATTGITLTSTGFTLASVMNNNSQAFQWIAGQY